MLPPSTFEQFSAFLFGAFLLFLYVSFILVDDVVLAEDDVFDAEFTLRTLRDVPLSNPVVHLKDGEEVLDYLYCEGAYLGRTLPDTCLVILDIHMPKVDGIEVLRRIRADPGRRNMPVIVLAHSAEAASAIEGYGLGRNAYVSKPVGLAQLEEALASLGMRLGEAVGPGDARTLERPPAT